MRFNLATFSTVLYNCDISSVLVVSSQTTYKYTHTADIKQMQTSLHLTPHAGLMPEQVTTQLGHLTAGVAHCFLQCIINHY